MKELGIIRKALIQLNGLVGKIGNLSTLTTTNKDTLVDAINEINLNAIVISEDSEAEDLADIYAICLENIHFARRLVFHSSKYYPVISYLYDSDFENLELKFVGLDGTPFKVTIDEDGQITVDD